MKLLNAVASVIDNEFTAVPGSPMKLQHNGEGELILTIGDNQYLIKELGNILYVVGRSAGVIPHNDGTTGIVIE
jgi:hypothetical protein